MTFLVKMIFSLWTWISDLHWGKFHFEADSHKQDFKPYMQKDFSISLSGLYNSLEGGGRPSHLGREGPCSPSLLLSQWPCPLLRPTEGHVEQGNSNWKKKNKHWAAPAPRITEVGEGWAPVWRRARNQRKPAGDDTLFLFLFFNFLFKGDILGEVKCIRRWTFTNWAPLCNLYPDQKTEHDQPLEGLLVAPSSH